MIPLTIFLAAILLYTEGRLTYYNRGSIFNGYGSIRGVLDAGALAPMQYRVLVPWLYSLLPDKWSSYLMVKGLGIWFALYAFTLFCGQVGVDPVLGVLALAAVMPMMFLFDYADCYYEFGFLALAYAFTLMGGSMLWWLIPITILATLNRETGVFIPIGYWVFTGGWIGLVVLLAVWLIAYLTPRMIYGRKSWYCKTVMFKANKHFLTQKWVIEHYIFSALMFWFAGVGVLSLLSSSDLGSLKDLYLLKVLFLIVMLIPSIWHEVRVFMPLLIVLIPLTIKLL